MNQTLITAKNAAKQEFLGTVRALVRAYQAFTVYDAAHLRQLGLTPPQADVVFSLGNTPGMTFREIGEHTLITKGTLTGVIDRLEEKGLVKRHMGSEDRRCTLVMLTPKGVRLFEKVFPEHIAYLKQRFDRLSKTEHRQVQILLKKIQEIL